MTTPTKPSKDLNQKIIEIREGWGEYSEYCQDQIMEAIESNLKQIKGTFVFPDDIKDFMRYL